MDFRLEERLLAPLLEREKSGLERRVRLFDSGDGFLDLSNNDYLGLAKHPKIVEAAKKAIDRFGCSSSSSPLITGFGVAHEELLESLLVWHGFEHGMIWNTGYAANQAVLSVLPQKGDLILADRLIHNSMVTGILRSGARLIRYPHCSVEDLEVQLEKESNGGRIVFVVTESVFSMDGDYPDLSRIAALKEKYPFFWIVDEAHALGWYGEKGSGLVEAFDVAEHVDLVVGTMGKGLGSMGAYTLFHNATLKRYFENFSNEFIYSTYLSPVSAAVGKASIELIQGMSFERVAARKYSMHLRKRLQDIGLLVPAGDAPIVPVVMGKADVAIGASKSLEDAGIRVGAIRPPTVPKGESRLRISLKVGMSQGIKDKIVETLKPYGREVREG